MAVRYEHRVPMPGYPPPRRVRPEYARVAVDPSETAQVTVVVRSKGRDEAWRELVAASMSGLPQQRKYLSRAELGEAWGASEEDLATIIAYGKAQGLTIVSSDAWRRCVILSGTVAQLQAAFGVQCYGVEHPYGRFRSHHGVPQLPPPVAQAIEAVLGLDNLPSAEPHAGARGSSGRSGLNVGDLRAAYDFPPQSGKGQCVAIIELGGGIDESGYTPYFQKLGVSVPSIRIDVLPGASNDPAPPSVMQELASAIASGGFPPAPHHTITGSYLTDMAAEWTWEATMDVEIVGTLAPGAEIVVTYGTYDDQGQYLAITSVLADAQNAPSVVSCSWGMVETWQTPALMQVLDRWFQAAAILGVTFCFSSGDYGDGTLEETSQPLDFTVFFPASSPYVLACGATTLDIAAGTECAWNQSIDQAPAMAGGGGFSAVFEPSAWQTSAGISSTDWIPGGDTSGTGRALPDVSARADLDPAFLVLAGEVPLPAGGTSAAAPLWAALAAVLNEALGCALGSINVLLYDGTLDGTLRDITQGNIGHLPAGKGWDPATGWGSPHGQAMLDALRGGA